MPLVRPSEHEHPGASRLGNRVELPRERVGLFLLAFAPAVQTKLGEQQRPVVREVLQARQIAREQFPPLEVDVEGDEVEVRQPQILGRGIVDIGDERLWILVLRGAAQPCQEPLGASAAVPANDRRGDLVPDRVGQYSRVAGTRPDRVADGLLDRVAPADVQEGDVLLPRDAHQDQQAVLVREVERPPRRSGVDANRIDPGFRHPHEVARGGMWLEASIRLRAERAVRDALDGQLAITEIQRLPAYGGALARRQAGHARCGHPRGRRERLCSLDWDHLACIRRRWTCCLIQCWSPAEGSASIS
jgi:hypothetical protein